MSTRRNVRVPSEPTPPHREAGEDEWRDVQDIDERRRVQNRLSQRKRRNNNKITNTRDGPTQYTFIEPNTVTPFRAKAARTNLSTGSPTTGTGRAHSIQQQAEVRESQPGASRAAPLGVNGDERATWDSMSTDGGDSVDLGGMLWDGMLFGDQFSGTQMSPFDLSTMSQTDLGPLSSMNNTGPTPTTAAGTGPHAPPQGDGSNTATSTWQPNASGGETGPSLLGQGSDITTASIGPVLGCAASTPAGVLSGYAALHLAACRGRLAIVQLLVEQGIAVDQLSDDHRTALGLAVDGGHIDVIRYLVNHGANLHMTDGDGSTVLHLAARCGNCPAVELLLGAMNDTDAVDNHGYTALHTAVDQGHTDVVRLMIDRGVDAQVKTALTKG